MGEAVTAPNLYTAWQVAVSVTIIVFLGAAFMTATFVIIDRLTRWITKGEQYGAATQTEDDAERRLPEGDDVHGQTLGQDQTGSEADKGSNGIAPAGVQSPHGPEDIPEVPGDIQPTQTPSENNTKSLESAGQRSGTERDNDTESAPVSDSDTRRVPRRPPAHVRETLRRAASSEDHPGSLNNVIHAFIEVFGRGK